MQNPVSPPECFRGSRLRNTSVQTTRGETMKRGIPAAVAGFALAAAFLVSAASGFHGGPGVKTTKQPFLVGTAPGVVVDPILSTGDIVPTGQAPPYQMSGIPDGLGAYANKDHGREHGRHRHGGKLPETFTV